MENTRCESCGMPLAKSPGVSGSDKYCSHCFKDGMLVGGDDLKEFQRHAYEGMVAGGMSKPKAWFLTFLIRFAPRWKKQ